MNSILTFWKRNGGQWPYQDAEVVIACKFDAHGLQYHYDARFSEEPTVDDLVWALEAFLRKIEYIRSSPKPF